MEERVVLAAEGTPMARFQKERTDAISEMFDNEDEHGIYPTTKFFVRLDKIVSDELAAERCPAEVVLAIKILVGHVGPGWENCKTTVRNWLAALREGD